MRKSLPDRLEIGRYGGNASDGAYGAFDIHGPCGERLRIIASGADDDDELSAGWEHVSISTVRRCPNWTEMCFVKNLFWEPEECVVQYHPPQSEYVNNHPYVLHLWRHKTIKFPTPPSILVGIKGVGELTKQEAFAIRNAIGTAS